MTNTGAPRRGSCRGRRFQHAARLDADAMAAPRLGPEAPRTQRNRPVPQVPTGPPSRRETDGRSTVEQLCTLSTFQGSFHLNEFISALCEESLEKARGQPVFDPKPMALTLEQAIQELQSMKSKVDERSTALHSAVQVSQSVYTKKIRQLMNNFDATQSSFNSLQERISDVGRTAIRIGEQLEALDRQRNRASETHDLIEYYYMFARKDTKRIDQLRKEGGREGRLKAATVLRRLNVISREVDIEGSADTREAIERYCEQFERDMLKLFDKYYRRSDPKLMSHIAHVLQRFNGGMSCINIYVNQHDFFISKDRIVEADKIGSSPVWHALTQPNAPPPRTEPSLDHLFTEIRKTVELEAQIIAAVFPTPLVVMQLFLQRVFAQSVQTYVETIMHRALDADAAELGLPRQDPASDVAGLAFLRMLHVTRSATLQLVTDLKTIDLRSAGITTGATPYSSSGLDGLFSIAATDAEALLGTDSYSAAQLAAAGGSVLGAMLDQSVDELFSPYLDHVRYLDRECRLLSGLYAAALQAFFTWHRQTIKASRANATIFSRVRDQFTGSNNSLGSSMAFATLADSAGYGAAAPMSSFKRLVDRASGAASLEDDAALPAPTQEQGELTIGLAERMLRWHAEALGRCVDLCPSTDVPKSTFTLLRVLTDAYLKAYVEAALETMTVQMFGYDVRSTSPPDLMVLGLLQRVEELVELWQHYVHTAVLPLTASSVTIRRETAIYNNHNLLRVEGKAEALVQKWTDSTYKALTTPLRGYRHAWLYESPPLYAKEDGLLSEERRCVLCAAQHGAMPGHCRCPGRISSGSAAHAHRAHARVAVHGAGCWIACNAVRALEKVHRQRDGRAYADQGPRDVPGRMRKVRCAARQRPLRDAAPARYALYCTAWRAQVIHAGGPSQLPR